MENINELIEKTLGGKLSTEVNAAYLVNETKVWKQDSTNHLYPFSKGELWEHISRQGEILILQDLKDASFWPKVNEFVQAKDKKGLSDYLIENQKPSDRIQAAKKDVVDAKKNAPLNKKGGKSAPSYSMETKRTIHFLFENEGWNKSKIAEELGVTPPTVTSAIEKINAEVEKEKAKVKEA